MMHPASLNDACYHQSMAITLRDIPEELEKILEQRAKAEGLSMNRTVIKMLEEASGLAPEVVKPKLNHDFDEFAGIWTDEEADEFDKRIAEISQIDWEMWK
jgi:hypothetical protein